MSPRGMARLLLTIAGLYDGILGALFLFAAPTMFSIGGIPAPPHWGYVQFGAALLMIFALMFFAAAAQPAGNRNLIAYGMLLKIAYVGVVLYHWVNGGVPLVFKLFLVLDVAWFFVLCWVFYTVWAPREAAHSGAAPAAGKTGIITPLDD